MPARKSEPIIASAKKLFLERGYDGTSLDDVAAASGVSKTTVYSNFQDKETLFARVLDQATSRAEAIHAELHAPLVGDGPVEDRLREFGRRLLAGVLQPDVVALRRLAITEALRFPALAATYWDRGPAPTVALLTEALTACRDRGELDLDEPAAAALGLAYALTGPPQDRALLTPDSPMTDAEVDAHVDHAITTFVRAYAPSSP
jgi:TetR/AcrR family transcriptional regulator, mexJK operon transcriptional repressor